MKYFIKTFGCQMNFSDSERIHTLMQECGFKYSKDIDDADHIIINTCGVRQTAEDRLYGHVQNIRKKNKDVVITVTGCLARREDIKRKLKSKVNFFIPTDNILDLPKKLGVNGKVNSRDTAHYLDLQPQYTYKDSIFMPIMTGCDNFCSYCVVPYARGRERSRPVKNIADEIAKARSNNTKNILLLGQNVNSYSYDGISFVRLLEKLVQLFSGMNFSFLTSHPKDFSDGLIDTIAKHDNISRHIHLPMQSGSDNILKAMSRKYTCEHYLNIISKIRLAIPDSTISTDVIVGFPGETEKEFQQTVNVFKMVNFSGAFINKYSSRPGTSAEKLGDPVLWKEKKRRAEILRSCL
ncbi:MAG: MiaB/RimO family radical SAM methylthiotransferase [Patescibacteria group bacterium]|nr:MiaB/RimO family radical SAM methylthiotransferase [Patescibacteria group bacterium]